MIRPLCPVQTPFMKAPLGFGYMGVIEYDEELDVVRCHDCGKWFEYLAPHLRVHATSASAYKIKYGLNFNQPLCGKKLSAQRREQMDHRIMKKGHRALRNRLKMRGIVATKPRHVGTATEAQKNKHGLCDLQMRTRYELVKQRTGDRSPTTQELKAQDPALLAAIERRHGTLNEWRKLVGEKPMTAQDHQALSQEKILEKLRAWKEKHGRTPKCSDWTTAHKGYPQASSVYAYFGSWTSAVSLI